MASRKMDDKEKVLAQRVLKVLVDRKLISGYCDTNRIQEDEYDYGVGVYLDTKSAYALPASDDSTVAHIVFRGMYESDIPREDKFRYDVPQFGFDTLEALADVFGSRKINLGDVYGGGGCETCGYGGSYRQDVYVHDVKVLVPLVPVEDEW